MILSKHLCLMEWADPMRAGLGLYSSLRQSPCAGVGATGWDGRGPRPRFGRKILLLHLICLSTSGCDRQPRPRCKNGKVPEHRLANLGDRTAIALQPCAL